MRGTLTDFLAWGRLTFGTRGFPVLIVLVTAGAPIAAIACDDTGPSPIGVYADPDASAAEETPAEDAGEDAGEDASDDAATDKDGGSDAGDAGDADADAKTG